MPAITVLGDFRLGDEAALQDFLDAHNRAHMQYARQLQLPGGDLSGPVNADWHLRHTARHVTLAIQSNHQLASADTKVLATPWITDQQLGDWQGLHNRLHQYTDKMLDVSQYPAARRVLNKGAGPHGR